MTLAAFGLGNSLVELIVFIVVIVVLVWAARALIAALK